MDYTRGSQDAFDLLPALNGQTQPQAPPQHDLPLPQDPPKELLQVDQQADPAKDQLPDTSLDHSLDKIKNVPDIKVELSKADLPMSYGAYGRPRYDNMTLLGALPSEYVPTSKNKRRLIVIGDIHGMLDPLDRLLEQCEYDSRRDHLIAVGDMVNKGNSSAAVVSRLMELGASAVRGNHEDRVLLTLADLESRAGVEANLASPYADAHRGESKDLKTALSLDAEQIEWLKSLPVILTVDPLSVYIVHAGLVPGIELQKQDPWAAMNMRTMRYPRAEFRKSEAEKKKKEEEKKKKEIDEKKKKEAEAKKKQEAADKAKKDDEARQKEEEELKQKLTVTSGTKKQGVKPLPLPYVRRHAPAEGREVITGAQNQVGHLPAPDHDVWIPTSEEGGDPWSDVWNREQGRIQKEYRHTVIYGHHAKRGYTEGAYTFGLDSSCVKGGVLTGFVIEADGQGGWKHLTEQVPCKVGKEKS